ncbi:unnamed protein product [Soboliphyme baturini]|uniref:4_1_CTD domain-containing protein n=1 Tax=Soboliphyme baturini TaxID=241478 RepID=A0A183IUK2_9BILA|nr:unnamed protein product [Soboliphyme baturini]
MAVNAKPLDAKNGMIEAELNDDDEEEEEEEEEDESFVTSLKHRIVILAPEKKTDIVSSVSSSEADVAVCAGEQRSLTGVKATGQLMLEGMKVETQQSKLSQVTVREASSEQAKSMKIKMFGQQVNVTQGSNTEITVESSRTLTTSNTAGGQMPAQKMIKKTTRESALLIGGCTDNGMLVGGMCEKTTVAQDNAVDVLQLQKATLREEQLKPQVEEQKTEERKLEVVGKTESRGSKTLEEKIPVSQDVQPCAERASETGAEASQSQTDESTMQQTTVNETTVQHEVAGTKAEQQQTVTATSKVITENQVCEPVVTETVKNEATLEKVAESTDTEPQHGAEKVAVGKEVANEEKLASAEHQVLLQTVSNLVEKEVRLETERSNEEDQISDKAIEPGTASNTANAKIPVEWQDQGTVEISVNLSNTITPATQPLTAAQGAPSTLEDQLKELEHATVTTHVIETTGKTEECAGLDQTSTSVTQVVQTTTMPQGTAAGITALPEASPKVPSETTVSVVRTGQSEVEQVISHRAAEGEAKMQDEETKILPSHAAAEFHREQPPATVLANQTTVENVDEECLSLRHEQETIQAGTAVAQQSTAAKEGIKIDVEYETVPVNGQQDIPVQFVRADMTVQPSAIEETTKQQKQTAVSERRVISVSTEEHAAVAGGTKVMVESETALSHVDAEVPIQFVSVDTTAAKAAQPQLSETVKTTTVGTDVHKSASKAVSESSEEQNRTKETGLTARVPTTKQVVVATYGETETKSTLEQTPAAPVDRVEREFSEVGATLANVESEIASHFNLQNMAAEQSWKQSGQFVQTSTIPSMGEVVQSTKRIAEAVLKGGETTTEVLHSREEAESESQRNSSLSKSVITKQQAPVESLLYTTTFDHEVMTDSIKTPTAVTEPAAKIVVKTEEKPGETDMSATVKQVKETLIIEDQVSTQHQEIIRFRDDGTVLLDITKEVPTDQSAIKPEEPKAVRQPKQPKRSEDVRKGGLLKTKDESSWIKRDVSPSPVATSHTPWANRVQNRRKQMAESFLAKTESSVSKQTERGHMISKFTTSQQQEASPSHSLKQGVTSTWTRREQTTGHLQPQLSTGMTESKTAEQQIYQTHSEPRQIPTATQFMQKEQQVFQRHPQQTIGRMAEFVTQEQQQATQMMKPHPRKFVSHFVQQEQQIIQIPPQQTRGTTSFTSHEQEISEIQPQHCIIHNGYPKGTSAQVEVQQAAKKQPPPVPTKRAMFQAQGLGNEGQDNISQIKQQTTTTSVSYYQSSMVEMEQRASGQDTQHQRQARSPFRNAKAVDTGLNRSVSQNVEETESRLATGFRKFPRGKLQKNWPPK